MTLELTLPENAPQPGTYQHYKGPLYQVLGMAQHSETDEWMVVYQALYGQYGFWLRPLSVWLAPVDTPSGTDTIHQSVIDSGISKPADPATLATQRFTLVTPADTSLTQLSKMPSATGV